MPGSSDMVWEYNGMTTYQKFGYKNNMYEWWSEEYVVNSFSYII